MWTNWEFGRAILTLVDVVVVVSKMLCQVLFALEATLTAVAFAIVAGIRRLSRLIFAEVSL